MAGMAEWFFQKGCPPLPCKKTIQPFQPFNHPNNQSMIFKNILTAAFFLALPSIVFSQNRLTQKQAVANTLENNYGIRIAKNDVEVARNNTDRRANGYNPTLNASAGPTASLSSSSQKFNGPLEDVEINNAFSWAANASVRANYTLFDKSRDYNLEQLKEVLDLTDLQLRQTVETNILQVLNSYYEVARLTEKPDRAGTDLQCVPPPLGKGAIPV